MNTPALTAEIVAELTGRAPGRFVVVDDPELPKPVRVRWRYGMPDDRMWRCDECGFQDAADCSHTFAAGVLLAEELLGLTRVPELNPKETTCPV